MNRPGRILILEDQESWREGIQEDLAPGGYHVEAVANQAEAFQRLASGLFHLLIVDLNLHDDDRTNMDGMEFLRELRRYGLNEAFRIIVLTAYGTHDRMREAFRQLGVNDFLKKQDYEEVELLPEVQRVLQEMEIRLDLVVHWQGLSPEQAVLNLKMSDSRVKKGSPRQVLLARELEDLLCRLFHDADSLLVGPLGGGKSGAGVLLVQPLYAAGSGRPVVVKFGDPYLIDQEHENFRRHVLPYVGGRSTMVQSRRRTANLGGLVYSLVGGVGGDLKDFATFYRSASIDRIRQVLDGLFFDTCGAWYEHPGEQRHLDLSEHYFRWLDMTTQDLEQGLGWLKSVQGKERLHFRNLSAERSFPNPLQSFPAKPIFRSTFTKITHGDLSPYNILLDKEDHSWLIDFQRTGSGHFLRDAVELDVTIRLVLLKPEEATLDERLALEEALARPGSFSQLAECAADPPTANPAGLKAFFACMHLRDLAGRLVARHTSTDLSEYYAGALLCALNSLRFQSLPATNREHAILSACVLMERLGL